MPNPKPKETKEEFISRYMSSEEAKNDYPDEKQRLAIAHSKWSKMEKVRKFSSYKEEYLGQCPLYKSMFTEEEKPVQIQKFVEDEQNVFGWANVSLDTGGNHPLDWDGDQCDPEQLEKASYKFVTKCRESGEMHAGKAKGELIESIMFTKAKMNAMGIPEGCIPEGWWVGFHYPDKEVFNKVKSGKYKMFSIQGKAKRIPLKEGE